MKYLVFLLTLIFLESCSKSHVENLIVGDWKIQSVTFNGVEKKGDSLLRGITHYTINYGYATSNISPKYGTMEAKTSTDLNVLEFPFGLIQSDTLQIDCSYDPGSLLSESYLPYMIDSSLAFCGHEKWRITGIDRHNLSLHLLHNGNEYNLILVK